MFDKLFGKMEGQREEMKARLRDVVLEAEAGDGALHVKVNASREILDVHFNREKFGAHSADYWEDLLVVALNQALDMAAEREAEEARKMIEQMIPPGLGGLFGMK